MSASGGPGSASEVLRTYLVTHAEALDRDLDAVRHRLPEGVHRVRIDCRRLRAALATYRPLVACDGAERLRDELRWVGADLSDARDRHVVRTLLLERLRIEPPGLVTDSLRRRLERTYGGTSEPPPELASTRFAALQSDLGRLIGGIPATDDGPDVLRARVRREVRRVQKRHEAVAEAADRDTALHDVRKAAKRLRYSAEVWEPLGGKDARRVRRAAKRLTSHLGERQDTVLTRAHLLRLAAAADEDAEPSFGYGRLHVREQQRAEALDRALPQVWQRFIGPATRSTC